MKIISLILMKVILLSCAIILFCSGQLKAYSARIDTGKVSSQVRSLKTFNAIVADGALNILVTQGAKQSVIVRAPKAGILKYIKTEVLNGELRIYIEKNNAFNWGNWGYHSAENSALRPDSISVNIILTAVKSIRLSGSANLYFINGLHADSLNLDIGTSARLKGNVSAHLLTGRLHESGSIFLGGESNIMNLNIGGSALLDASRLSVDVAIFNLQGSSVSQIYVKKSLQVRAQGNSRLSYSGTPIKTAFDKSGNAEIQHVEE